MIRILILQTLSRPKIFSVNNALLTLARHLDRSRFEMSVALPCSGPLAEALRQEGASVVYVPGLRTYRRHDAIWRLPWVGFQVARIARRLGADLVLSNHAELGPFAMMAARLNGIPWISFLRQADRSPVYYEKYRLSRADAVGSVSEAALAAYRSFLDASRLPSNRTRVIPTGISLPPECDRSAGPGIGPELPAYGGKSLGTVGLRKVKRPELLIDALGCLRDRFPRLRVLVIGGAEPEDFARLAARARSHAIEDRVIFAGQQQDMSAWYRSMDIYCHTSDSEALPKAVLEAMAHSLPVVASRVGGVSEAVLDGTTGILVDPGDIRSLSEAVARLLEDSGLAARMGQAARRRVEASFSPESMARGFMEFFDEVLNGRGSEAGTSGRLKRA